MYITIMPFCGKSQATMKSGKVRKGYREVVCKNGSIKYMTEPSKPVVKVTAAKEVKPKPVKEKAVKPKPVKEKVVKPKPVKEKVKVIRTRRVKEESMEELNKLPLLTRSEDLHIYQRPVEIEQPLTIL